MAATAAVAAIVARDTVSNQSTTLDSMTSLTNTCVHCQLSSATGLVRVYSRYAPYHFVVDNTLKADVCVFRAGCLSQRDRIGKQFFEKIAAAATTPDAHISKAIAEGRSSPNTSFEFALA